jgi:hypothetical protein
VKAADVAIAVAPRGAAELRIARYRPRKPTGRSASEWVGNEIMGGDGGLSDGPRPLRAATVDCAPAVAAGINRAIGAA